MTTVAECIERELRNARDTIGDLEWLQEKIGKHFPELLEIEAPIVGTGYQHLYFYDKDSEHIPGRLMVKLLEWSGKERVTKKPAFGNTGRYASFTLPIENDYLFIQTYHKSNGCRKYRVVEEREIEACGELDRSKYLSVEEIE